MKTFNFLSLLATLTISAPAIACMTLPTEVTLNNSSLAKQKIEVLGNKIILDGGTTDEAVLTYNTSKKLWCMTAKYYQNSSNTCLKPIGKDEYGKYSSFEFISDNGHRQEGVLNLTKSDGAIANIQISGEDLYIIDANNSKKYLSFSDDSEGSSEKLVVNARLCGNDRFSGCFGGSLVSVRNSYARSLSIGSVPKTAAKEAVNLANKEDWKTHGCGSGVSIRAAEKSSNSTAIKAAQ